MLRITLAALHLFALGIGFFGIWSRVAAVVERPLNAASGRRAIRADAWWGIAAVLWIVTGFWRGFASTEKVTAYYIHNHIFAAKMGLFTIIFVLEIWAMQTFAGWRALERKFGDAWVPDARQAQRIRAISMLEAIILMGMIVAAVMMARGYGT